MKWDVTNIDSDLIEILKLCSYRGSNPRDDAAASISAASEGNWCSLACFEVLTLADTFPMATMKKIIQGNTGKNEKVDDHAFAGIQAVYNKLKSDSAFNRHRKFTVTNSVRSSAISVHFGSSLLSGNKVATSPAISILKGAENIFKNLEENRLHFSAHSFHPTMYRKLPTNQKVRCLFRSPWM